MLLSIDVLKNRSDGSFFLSLNSENVSSTKSGETLGFFLNCYYKAKNQDNSLDDALKPDIDGLVRRSKTSSALKILISNRLDAFVTAFVKLINSNLNRYHEIEFIKYTLEQSLESGKFDIQFMIQFVNINEPTVVAI